MSLKFGNIWGLLCLLVGGLFASCAWNREAVQAADIVRTEYVPEGVIPLYLGNGRFGGCFDQSGLQENPQSTASLGSTSLMHVQHHGRGRFDMDYLLPLARVYWADSLQQVRNYRQHQKLYDGLMETSFTSAAGNTKIVSWFDAVDRNLFFIKTNCDGASLVVAFPDTIVTHYKSRFLVQSSIEKVSGGWRSQLSYAGKTACCYISTDAPGEVRDGKLYLDLKGRNTVCLSYGEPADVAWRTSLNRTRKWWHRQWAVTAFVDIPDPAIRNFYVHNMAQLFATYNEDGLGLMPPCGLSGNQWPFGFPHDLSFVLYTCLSQGRVDVAKSWLEYIAKDVEELRVFTRRVFGIDGIFSPWCYPYDGVSGLHEHGLPQSRAFYEIHNSGHLCRMAYETSLFVNDSSWTRTNALPLIASCAEFYRNMISKEEDGYWHVFHIPSFGQDENGGMNQKDYLDALYSARYCFETAVSCGLDPDGFYARVLQDGLAFPSLKSAKGYFFSCQGRGESDFGHQKHPVQLNEITLLPMSDGVSEEAMLAYKNRYDITERAAEPFFRGWTWGSFVLASARAADADGWRQDWNALLPSDNADPEMIQFYESSRLHKRAYFTTNSGLFVGSVLTCMVNDWEDEVKIGSCIPWQGRTEFRNIYSKTGVILSGWVDGVTRSVKAVAWKDCSVHIEGKLYTLSKGEQINIE